MRMCVCVCVCVCAPSTNSLCQPSLYCSTFSLGVVVRRRGRGLASGGGLCWWCLVRGTEGRQRSV